MSTIRVFRFILKQTYSSGETSSKGDKKRSKRNKTVWTAMNTGSDLPANMCMLICALLSNGKSPIQTYQTNLILNPHIL